MNKATGCGIIAFVLTFAFSVTNDCYAHGYRYRQDYENKKVAEYGCKSFSKPDKTINFINFIKAELGIATKPCLVTKDPAAPANVDTPQAPAQTEKTVNFFDFIKEALGIVTKPCAAVETPQTPANTVKTINFIDYLKDAFGIVAKACTGTKDPAVPGAAETPQTPKPETTPQIPSTETTPDPIQQVQDVVTGLIDGILNVPLSTQECAQFQNCIFTSYGFVASAADFIKTNSSLDVSNETAANVGGGWWANWDTHVHLDSTQHEAAVHELAHVWYDNLKNSIPDLANQLVAATIKLANSDPVANPANAAAITEAKSYVAKGWTDSTSSNYAPWELYASFASYTMGQMNEGARQLPDYLSTFYTTLFTGSLSATPYYEGGHR